MLVGVVGMTNSAVKTDECYIAVAGKLSSPCMDTRHELRPEADRVLTDTMLGKQHMGAKCGWLPLLKGWICNIAIHLWACRLWESVEHSRCHSAVKGLYRQAPATRVQCKLAANYALPSLNHSAYESPAARPPCDVLVGLAGVGPSLQQCLQHSLILKLNSLDQHTQPAGVMGGVEVPVVG